jgi:hypothetical protein
MKLTTAVLAAGAAAMSSPKWPVWTPTPHAKYLHHPAARAALSTVAHAEAELAGLLRTDET